MERKRFLAVVMTVMMVISMIPSMVFAAAPSGELGGKLKIKASVLRLGLAVFPHDRIILIIL